MDAGESNARIEQARRTTQEEREGERAAADKQSQKIKPLGLVMHVVKSGLAMHANAGGNGSRATDESGLARDSPNPRKLLPSIDRLCNLQFACRKKLDL